MPIEHRRLAAGPLVVASHNPGKVREIAALLTPFGIATRSAAALGLAEPEETGATFAENARLKALAAAEATGLPALADDSGLAVDALGGAPGVFSARWAGPGRDFRMAMEQVEHALQERAATDPAPRRARFVAALALAWPEGHIETFEGAVHGALVWPPRGEGGFGYDPMFVPDGHDRTFGELDAAVKHAISHRADAFRKLVDACLR